MLAAVIFVASEVQRSSADRSVDESFAAQSLLIAQIDLETGLRGFLQFGDVRFLEAYRLGSLEMERALADARATAAGEQELTTRIERQALLTSRWRSSAESAIARRRNGEMVSLSSALPDHAGDSAGLMRAADRALYAAKAAGRNRVELAGDVVEPSPPVAVLARGSGADVLDRNPAAGEHAGYPDPVLLALAEGLRCWRALRARVCRGGNLLLRR